MLQQHNYALILAGGRGTRFWPVSRRRRAKQVLDFLGGGSLIQQTVARLAPVVPPERVWVLTNAFLRDEIVRQLPGVPPRQILAEPAARNTAPAIGLAARILQEADPKAVMGVFPADQHVARPKPFLSIIRAAYRAAGQGKMALIGIQPRWPETGYGYVEFPRGGLKPGSLEPVPIRRFREKPQLPQAQRFVRSGHFAWNAGIFFWRAQVFQEALRTQLPATAALLDSLPPFTSSRFRSMLQRVFPQCENISVDYAILERARGVLGFAAGDVGWSDLGSWNAVYELLPHDAQGNSIRGDVVLEDSAGNLIDVPGKLVALAGVRNLVVVETPDALLICHRDQAQLVSQLVKQIEVRKREDLL